MQRKSRPIINKCLNQKFQYFCKAGKKNAVKKIINPIVAGSSTSSKDKKNLTDTNTDSDKDSDKDADSDT